MRTSVLDLIKVFWLMFTMRNERRHMRIGELIFNASKRPYNMENAKLIESLRTFKGIMCTLEKHE